MILRYFCDFLVLFLLFGFGANWGFVLGLVFGSLFARFEVGEGSWSCGSKSGFDLG